MNRYSVASLAIIACLCGGCTAPTTATTSEGMADSTSTGAAVAVEGADGKPTDNGPQVIHTKDGGRMEGMMRDGQRTGVWTLSLIHI